MINTGRHYLRAIDYAKQTQINYICAFNGTTLYDVEQKKVLSSIFLNSNSLQIAIQQAKEEKFLMGIWIEKGVLLLDFSEDQGHYDEYYKDLSIWKGTNPTLAKKYNEEIDLESFIKKYKDKIFKISYLFKKSFWENNRFDIMKRMQTNHKGFSQIYMGSLPDIEISVKNTSKFYGIKELISLLKIDSYKTISFGDGFNDIEMLKNSDLALVMDHAPQEVKKYCW